MAYWISGTVFKMIPCLLLAVFVWLLMRILHEVKQNRIKLMTNSLTVDNYDLRKKISSFENHKRKDSSTR